MIIIETERLILRAWQESDADRYFVINQDKKVIEFLPGPLTIEQVHSFMTTNNQSILEKEMGFFAVEIKQLKKLIGFIGMSSVNFIAHFTPAVEIGWRLASEFWGQGYATEGAKACLKHGFKKLALEEIIAFTVPNNQRSIQVMEKIGMQRDLKGDFYHPKLAADHPLAAHILYRIRKQQS